MNWEILIQILAVGGLFLWSRSESRSDCRRIEDLIVTFKDEVAKEIKDFHGRLCALEEKYRQGK